MTLADAIRKGAMQRPQTRNGLFAVDVHGAPTASCALGAAYEGVFGTPGAFDEEDEERWCDQLAVIYPEMLREPPGPTMFMCPMCAGQGEYHTEEDLSCMIVHLNDEDHWTREQIADWLDGLDGG